MRVPAVILVSSILLWSCNLPDYFAEYKDNNGNPINMIDGFELPPIGEDPGVTNENSGTKIEVIDSENVVIPDPATWGLSYGSNAITYPDYMSFGHTGLTISGVTGITDGSDIYYLDVNDLAPAGIMDSGNWTVSGGTFAGSGTLTVDLYASEYASYPINASLLDNPGNDPATYSTAVRLDYTIFDAHTATSPWQAFTDGGTDTNIYLSNFTNDSGLLFYIGAPTGVTTYGNNCTIYDISMARTDISHNFEFFIPEFAEGRPPIIDGSYRFSVWIKQDTDPATNDIESITLGISSYNTNEAYFESFNVNDLSGSQPVYPSGWSNWTRLDLITPIDSSVQLNQNNPSDYPAVVLTISPTYLAGAIGPESTMPGRILFTSPSLYLTTK